MTKTSRTRHRLIRAGLALLVAGFTVRPQLSADELPLAVVFGRWTTAVTHHTPGTSDAAVTAVWAMTPEDRQILRAYLHPFLTFLDGADFSHAKSDLRVVAAVASSLFPLGKSDFVERAATLHADAVIFDTHPKGPPTFDQPLGRGGPGARGNSGGQAVFFASTDGEYLNATVENPNWPLARLLLDDLPPGAASQAFATTWYHGVTVYLLAQGNFGQAETNLDHATQLMPKSPQTLFDLGCVDEAQGMNIFQQVILDVRDPLLGGRPGIISSPRTIPSAKTRNTAAAGFFDQALALDPHLPEARVRWARLLELDDRWTDATRQIELALSDRPDRDVAFFAHLFGARAANGLHNATSAEAHLADALRLFPAAESAILEASHTALTGNDAALAKSRLMSLADPGRDTSPGTDPWVAYPLGPGRLPELPLQALWRSVPAGAR